MIEAAAISAGLIKLPPQKPPPLPDAERRKLLEDIKNRIQQFVQVPPTKLLQAYEIGLAYQSVLDHDLYDLMNRTTSDELFVALCGRDVCPSLRRRYAHLPRSLSREMIEEAGKRLHIQDALCIAEQAILLDSREFPLGDRVVRQEWDAALLCRNSAAIQRIASAVTSQVQARLLANALLSDDELRQIIEAAQVETPEQLVQSLLDQCGHAVRDLLKHHQLLGQALVRVSPTFRQQVEATVATYTARLRASLDGLGPKQEPAREEKRNIPRDPETNSATPETSVAGADIHLPHDRKEYLPLPIPRDEPPPPPPRPERDFSRLSPEEAARWRAFWARADQEAAEEAARRAQQQRPDPIELRIDDLCCTSTPSPQVALIAYTDDGRHVGHDIFRPTASAILGPPGTGKSWYIGVTIENVTLPIPGVNDLKQAHCAISFHYHTSNNYESEMLAAVFPARSKRQLGLLKERGLVPQGHPDQVVFTIMEHVMEMRDRHRHLQIHGLLFPFCDLSIQGARIAMGLYQKVSPQCGRNWRRRGWRGRCCGEAG